MKNNKKSDHYQKYLASLHAKLVTPDEIIRGIIEEGADDNLVTKTRIIAGEVIEKAKTKLIKDLTYFYPNKIN